MLIKLFLLGWNNSYTNYVSICFSVSATGLTLLPWLGRRRTALLPSGPKSSFQMRASFVFHLETKVLESGGRVEKLIAQVAWSPVLARSVMIWGAMSSAGVGPLCFLKTILLHLFTNTFWSTSCFLLVAWSFVGKHERIQNIVLRSPSGSKSR